SELVVVTSTDTFESVKAAIEQTGLKYASAEVTMIPKNNVRIEGKEAEHMLRLMENLEDSDDVQNVYSNFDIAEELMQALG
ncbi:MAG TPA: YebC/PmpR family DNA-binding transcriptional regulator, partial [Thermodesulfobacteriota bacterium]|nr:YebC/PmpR family DNA-binding transcriptional regulator [Thermodesulfobacteriota bacterium]